MRRQVPLLLVTRHIRFRRIRSGLGGLGTDVATCVAGLVRVIAVEPTNVISRAWGEECRVCSAGPTQGDSWLWHSRHMAFPGADREWRVPLVGQAPTEVRCGVADRRIVRQI